MNVRNATRLAAIGMALLATAGLRASEPAGTLPARERFRLYLLIGQSNMVGRANVEEQDRVPHPRVLMLSEGDRWVPAIDPVHFDQRRAGVCLASTFARAMADAEPEVTIGLIPAAVNGTELSRWVKGADLHERAVVRAKAALKDGTLAGILWHQGEADTHEEQNARSYGERLAGMVTALRAELGAAEAPFVAGQLGDFIGDAFGPNKTAFWPRDPTYWTVVNEQIAGLPERLPGSAFVSATGLTSYDHVHFDAVSLRELGRRYAKAMLELRKKAPARR